MRYRRQAISANDPCDGSCPDRDHPFPVCYCDNDCTYYNDCCLDAIGRNKTDQGGNVKTIEDKIRYITCDVTSIVDNSITNLGYFMVTSCPNSENSKLASNCTNNVGINVPVSDKEGYTYRNTYCALCHGVTVYDVWGLSFLVKGCKTDLSIKDFDVEKRISILKQNGCPVLFLPPYSFSPNDKREDISPRACVKDETVVYSTNTECKKYQNPITFVPKSAYTLIRNYNCLKEDLQGTTRCYKLMENPYSSLFDVGMKGFNLGSMLIMFQFENPTADVKKKNCIDTQTPEVCRFTDINSNIPQILNPRAIYCLV